MDDSQIVLFMDNLVKSKNFKVYYNFITTSSLFVLIYLIIFYHTWDTKRMILVESPIVVV